RIHFVQGKVEETIPGSLPARIALLRLDTDWYESTRHELRHLYPLLSRLGVLVIDDYGYWQGARQAVDEYFAAQSEPVYLHRVDNTARLLVRQDGP
ncbi:MAG: TylF/MycF/NovP-related O-methyltransferase, partial [Caldimonas sp.]